MHHKLLRPEKGAADHYQIEKHAIVAIKCELLEGVAGQERNLSSPPAARNTDRAKAPPSLMHLQEN